MLSNNWGMNNNLNEELKYLKSKFLNIFKEIPGGCQIQVICGILTKHELSGVLKIQINNENYDGNAINVSEEERYSISFYPYSKNFPSVFKDDIDHICQEELKNGCLISEIHNKILRYLACLAEKTEKYIEKAQQHDVLTISTSSNTHTVATLKPIETLEINHGNPFKNDISKRKEDTETSLSIDWSPTSPLNYSQLNLEVFGNKMKNFLVIHYSNFIHHGRTFNSKRLVKLQKPYVTCCYGRKVYFVSEYELTIFDSHSNSFYSLYWPEDPRYANRKLEFPNPAEEHKMFYSFISEKKSVGLQISQYGNFHPILIYFDDKGALILCYEDPNLDTMDFKDPHYQYFQSVEVLRNGSEFSEEPFGTIWRRVAIFAETDVERRFGYSVTMISQNTFVIIGGKGVVNNHLFIVHSNGNFVKLHLTGELPILYEHSSFFYEDVVYIFGGMLMDGRISTTLYAITEGYDLTKQRYSSQRVFVHSPSPKLTKTLGFQYVHQDTFLLCGGIHFDTGEPNQQIFFYNVKEKRFSFVYNKNLKATVNDASEEGKQQQSEYGQLSNASAAYFMNNGLYIVTNGTHHSNRHGGNRVISWLDLLSFDEDAGNSSEMLAHLNKDYSSWLKTSQNEQSADILFLFSSTEKKIFAHRFMIKCMCKQLFLLVTTTGREFDGLTTVVLVEYYEDHWKVKKEIEEIVFRTLIQFLYTFTLTIDATLWSDDRNLQLFSLAKKFQCHIICETIQKKLSFETLYQECFLPRIKFYLRDFILGKLFPEKFMTPGHGLVKLIAEDGSGALYAHKGILQSRSSYFRSMFKKGFKEEEGNIVDLTSEQKIEIIYYVLEYFYTGEVPIDFKVQDAIPLYYICQTFEILELRQYLRNIIQNNVDENNVFGVLEFANILKDDPLQRICCHCIVNNYENIMMEQSEKYDALDPSLKLYIIQDIKKKIKSHNRKSKG